MTKKTKKVVKKLTAAQIKKIIVLKNKGLSNVAVANKVGCSDSTVAYHINKF